MRQRQGHPTRAGPGPPARRTCPTAVGRRPPAHDAARRPAADRGSDRGPGGPRGSGRSAGAGPRVWPTSPRVSHGAAPRGARSGPRQRPRPRPRRRAAPVRRSSRPVRAAASGLLPATPAPARPGGRAGGSARRAAEWLRPAASPGRTALRRCRPTARGLRPAPAPARPAPASRRPRVRWLAAGSSTAWRGVRGAHTGVGVGELGLDARAVVLDDERPRAHAPQGLTGSEHRDQLGF